MKKDVKVLSCPFCGNKPDVYHQKADKTFGIECLSCNFSLRSKFLEPLVIKWNTRLGDSFNYISVDVSQE